MEVTTPAGISLLQTNVRGVLTGARADGKGASDRPIGQDHGRRFAWHLDQQSDSWSFLDLHVMGWLSRPGGSAISCPRVGAIRLDGWMQALEPLQAGRAPDPACGHSMRRKQTARWKHDPWLHACGERGRQAGTRQGGRACRRTNFVIGQIMPDRCRSAARLHAFRASYTARWQVRR